MPDRIRLDGKVAVVTGAAGVIGAATMRLLAERGARIVAVDRKRHDLHAAIKDLPASAQALAVTADVSDEDEVAGLCPRRRRQVRHHRRVLQQCRHRGRHRADHRLFAQDVSPGARRQRGRRLPRHETCAAGDAEAEQRQHHQHRVDRRPDRIAGYCGLQRQQARGDRVDQKRRAGMRQDRRAGQLRLPRPDRQPDAERDPRRPQSRQRARCQ